MVDIPFVPDLTDPLGLKLVEKLTDVAALVADDDGTSSAEDGLDSGDPAAAPDGGEPG